MNRRLFLASVIASGCGAGALRAQDFTSAAPILTEDHPLQVAWSAWKELCLSVEGRVIDDYQGNASHSEGQGYGLTLAALFGDRQACERIIQWTEDNLAVRSDALLAWRWRPDTSPHVADRNNATDGDLFYAWGLSLYSRLPGAKDYTDRASDIARDVMRLCVTRHPDGSKRLLLIPGVAGFILPEGVVINPSYYMPLAMRELANLALLPQLAEVADTGQQLIEQLALEGLVPDWVLITPNGPTAPPPPFSDVAGYEAMRVPLMALWSGLQQSRAVSSYVDTLMAADRDGGVPTVMEKTGGRVLEHSTHLGYAALHALASCVISGEIGSLMPAFSSEQPYYPATLHMMALAVQATTYQRCVPI